MGWPTTFIILIDQAIGGGGVYSPSLDYSDDRNSQYFLFPGWL